MSDILDNIALIHVTYPISDEQNSILRVIKDNIEARRAYSDTLLLMIRGNIDYEKLITSINALVKRHEMLRTTFDSGYLKHVILPAIESIIDFGSIEDKKPLAKTELVKNWLEKIANHVFNLCSGSLFKFSILKYTANIYLIAITGVNIVSDGISFSLLVKDLFDIYFNNKLPSVMQHREFTILQKKLSEEYVDGIEYWESNLLSNLHSRIIFPFAKSRPKTMSFLGNHYQSTLNDRVMLNVNKFAKANKLTFFMCIFAAFCLTIHKLTNKEHLIIGVPFSLRDNDESNNCIGYCISILPLTSSISPNETLAEYLHKTRNIVLGAYENRFADPSEVLDKLNIKIDSTNPMFFDILFNFEKEAEESNYFGLEIEISGLNSPYKNLALDHSKPIQLSTKHSQFDLTFNILEQNNNYFCALEYNTDIFEREHIHMIFSKYIKMMTLFKNEVLNLNIETFSNQL